MKSSRLFAAILLAFLALGAIYSWSSPIFEAPDESDHFFVIYQLHQTGRLPVQDPATRALYRQEGSQAPLYYFAGALLISGLDILDAPDFVRENPQANIGI